jgi:phosphoribosylcarboxyaminoimidazole (NCAIR) mutase
MPGGVPVATVALNGAKKMPVSWPQIIGTHDTRLSPKAPINTRTKNEIQGWRIRPEHQQERMEIGLAEITHQRVQNIEGAPTLGH